MIEALMQAAHVLVAVDLLSFCNLERGRLQWELELGLRVDIFGTS